MNTSRVHLIQRRNTATTAAIIVVLASVFAFILLSFYGIGEANAQVMEAGSAVMEPVAPADAPDSTIEQLRELQAKYKALKAAGDKDPKTLLWAAMLAAGLKALLSILNRFGGGKRKKWLAWIAMSLSVPIALLSHYAGGHSWFDSLIFAGAGPGAVIFHELMKVFDKKAPEPSPGG